MDNLPRPHVSPHIAKLIARNISIRNGRRSYTEREWLRVRYEDRQMTLRQIASEAQCALRTIARWMDTHGIPTRDNITAIRLSSRRGSSNANWKGGNLCATCGRPKGGRASRLCWPCHIAQRSGPGNSNYKGISNVTIAVRQWCYDRWRTAIFERDGYTCQKCGDDKGGNLNAHHITPLATLIADRRVMSNLDLSTPEQRRIFIKMLLADPEITSLDNGITLCQSCHTTKHFLSLEDCEDLMYTYGAGGITQGELGAIYGVTGSAICYAIKRAKRAR